MLKSYNKALGRLCSVDQSNLDLMPAGSTWIDLDRPTKEEEGAVERQLGLDLPTADEMLDIEPSSRLYKENGALYLTANVVWRADSEAPETAPVTFVLKDDTLVTIRYSDPRAFEAFAAYAARHSDACRSGRHALIGLVEAIVDRAAEVLERSGREVDAISREIFRMKDAQAKGRGGSTPALRTLLARIALNQNLVTKVRDSLVSLGRLVSFFTAAQEAKPDRDLREHARSLARDIQSLSDHSSYISNNTSFLLDASLGLINLEQNEIIKIFSVAAVMFLPPTLVASIYGMNFDFMPELRWPLGYPFAIVLMIASAAIPFYYFKRRGWL